MRITRLLGFLKPKYMHKSVLEKAVIREKKYFPKLNSRSSKMQENVKNPIFLDLWSKFEGWLTFEVKYNYLYKPLNIYVFSLLILCKSIN